MNDFSITRVGQLLRNDIGNRYRTVLTTSLALAAAMAIYALIHGAINSDSGSFYPGWTTAILIIWGAIAASGAFKDMHDKHSNQRFLLLPASAAEKTLARWLQVCVVLPLYVVLLVSVVAFINGIISFAFFGDGTLLPKIVDDPSGLTGFFLINQSLFFLGGAWFRSNQLIKTALAISVSWILGGLGYLILLASFFPDFVNEDADFYVDFSGFSDAYAGAIAALGFLGVSLLIFGIPALCMLIAWMRVKETQVSHGI